MTNQFGMCSNFCVIKVFALCTFVGWIGSSLAIALGWSLLLVEPWQISLHLLLMPLVETLLFNYWFQQSIVQYGADRQWSSRASQTLSIGAMAFAFMLAHVSLVGFWSVLWFFVGLSFGLLWLLSQKVWLVFLVHAYWNLMLWFQSI